MTVKHSTLLLAIALTAACFNSDEVVEPLPPVDTAELGSSDTTDFESDGAEEDDTGAPLDIPVTICPDNEPGQLTGTDWGPCCDGVCGGYQDCVEVDAGSICAPDQCDVVATLRDGYGNPFVFEPSEGCRVPCPCPGGMVCDAGDGCVWAS